MMGDYGGRTWWYGDESWGGGRGVGLGAMAEAGGGWGEGSGWAWGWGGGVKVGGVVGRGGRWEGER